MYGIPVHSFASHRYICIIYIRRTQRKACVPRSKSICRLIHLALTTGQPIHTILCSVLEFQPFLQNPLPAPHRHHQNAMAGETGGDREGPSPPGPINSIAWVGPGGTQYITKMGPFTSIRLFFSNCKSCMGSFGPFETLGDPFPRGPPRPSPLPPLESFLQPCRMRMHTSICHSPWLTTGIYIICILNQIYSLPANSGYICICRRHQMKSDIS